MISQLLMGERKILRFFNNDINLLDLGTNLNRLILLNFGQLKKRFKK